MANIILNGTKHITIFLKLKRQQEGPSLTTPMQYHSESPNKFTKTRKGNKL